MTVALVVLALAAGLAVWVYFRLEFASPGRPFLLAARLAALAGLAAILWNPDVADWSERGRPPRYVLLDASLSMTATGRDGAALWDGAAARAEALAAEGARVLLAGTGGAGGDSLRSVSPDATESRLSAAFSVAAEAGAGEVVLLTDRRVQDPVALAAAARRLGVGLSVDTAWAPDAAAPNLGVSRLLVPPASGSSSPLAGRVGVEGDWGADSVSVLVSVDGVVREVLRLGGFPGWGARVADFVVAPPIAPGPRRVSATIVRGDGAGPVPASPGAGPAPAEFADAFPLDDERVAIVRIDSDETGVLLVALAPDWEARFLLPVLEQATGLPVRGYLRTGPDRFHPMVSPTAAAAEEEVGAAALADMVRQARLVVALGARASGPDAVGDAIAGADRKIVFAADAAAAGLANATRPLRGEWYAEAASPSPLAGDLAGVSWRGLPPLARLLPAGQGPRRAALAARRNGGAEAHAAVVLDETGERRVATALAGGFWRWAARGGRPREAYRRLWAAVGGWTMAGGPPPPASGTRPADDVAERGAPVRWLTAGEAGDSLRLTIARNSGPRAAAAPPPAARDAGPAAEPQASSAAAPARAESPPVAPVPAAAPPPPPFAAAAPALDTALALPVPGAAFATPSLPPGTYRYRASSSSGTTEGTFEVAAFTAEMLRPAVAPSVLSAPSADGGAGRSRRPLRTSSLPYLLVLAALCAEWVGRRRAGLR